MRKLVFELAKFVFLSLLINFHYIEAIKYLKDSSKEMSRKEVNTYLILSLGFTSVIFQIVILRELLSVVNGNELSVGIFLAMWLFLTGLGAIVSNFFKIEEPKGFLSYFLIFSILPFFTIICFRVFWYSIFIPGELIGVIPLALVVLILLLPFTFLSGVLFTQLSSFRNEKSKIGYSYSVETFGSMFGSIFAGLLMIYYFNSLQIIIIVTLANLMLLIYYSFINSKNNYLAICCFILSGFISLLFNDIDLVTKNFLFPGQKLIEQRDTPFGNVAITKTGKQLNVFESGILSATSENIINNEETVHFVMVQYLNPKKVLIIGNAVFGIIDEIMKYKPDIVDIIEPNEYIFEIDKKYYKRSNNILNNHSVSVNLINNDPRLFLKESYKQYDVIILNIPSPLTAQLNRMYSLEFFQRLKKHLTDKGIVSLKTPATENYIGKNSVALQSIIYNTLKNVFKNVIIIPGSSNHFLASDDILSYNITKEIELRGIETKYVNKFYLNEYSILQRADFIISSLDAKAEINTDFKPVAFYSNIDYFLSYFEINKTWIVVVIIIIFLLILIRMNTFDFIMFSTGYAIMLSEIIIILSFQILFGNLYQHIGIIFALFMFGMSSGAIFIHRKSNIGKSLTQKKLLIGMLLLLAFFLAMLPFIKMISHLSINEYLIYLILFVLILAISFLAGGLFTNLSFQYNKDNRTIAAKLYSLDMFGSAFGAILPTCFLLPVLGLEVTSYTATFLLFISFLLFVLKK